MSRRAIVFSCRETRNCSARSPNVTTRFATRNNTIMKWLLISAYFVHDWLGRQQICICATILTTTFRKFYTISPLIVTFARRACREHSRALWRFVARQSRSPGAACLIMPNAAKWSSLFAYCCRSIVSHVVLWCYFDFIKHYYFLMTSLFGERLLGTDRLARNRLL